MKEELREYRIKLNYLKTEGTKLNKLREEVRDNWEKINRRLNAQVQEILYKHLGHITMNWFIDELNLTFYLSYIQKFHIYRFMGAPLRWAKEDPHSGPGHRYGMNCEGPFPITRIEDMLQEIENITGLETTYAFLEQAPLNKPYESRSFAELDRWFCAQGKKVKFIADGEKQYMGWDCTDYWVELEIDGVHTAYWTTDAHGDSFSQSASKVNEAEWAKFAAWRQRES